MYFFLIFPFFINPLRSIGNIKIVFFFHRNIQNGHIWNETDILWFVDT